MKNEIMCRFDRLTSELCFELDDLERQLDRMTLERDEYKRKYTNLLNAGLVDANRTTGAILKLALDGHLNLPRKSANAMPSENDESFND